MTFDREASNNLLEFANDGAKSLKALFFWYVGALTYAVISVAGVSDEQLLKSIPLKLPIISVDIPLVEYFAFLPLVVVIVHLELLVQFALLSNKINDFHRSLKNASRVEREGFRLRLENFMLSHLLAGDHRAILRCLLFFLMYGALVVLPLFSLLLIQAQFLAYHSELMMWWHRALILVDALALLYFWPNLFHRADMKAVAWARLMVFRVLPHALALLLLLALIYLALAFLNWPLAKILFALGVALAICLLMSVSGREWLRLLYRHGDQDANWRKARRLAEFCSHHLTRAMILGVLAFISYKTVKVIREFRGDADPSALEIPLLTLLALIVGGAIILASAHTKRRGGPLQVWYRRLTYWGGRINTLSLRRDAPGMTVFVAQCVVALILSWLILSIPSAEESRADLFGVCDVARAQGAFGLEAKDTPQDGYSNTLLTVPAWYILLTPSLPTSIDDYVAINIGAASDESLSYVNDVCIEGWAELLSGDTMEAQSPINALLLAALGKHRVLHLNERILADQELTPEQEQKLRSKEDDAAWRTVAPIDLRNRNLTGIQLKQAILPRALLDGAKLDFASLVGAQLQGASMVRASVKGANLWKANLNEASLDEAKLHGAVLDAASLRSASLKLAHLQGAMFFGSDLRNAKLDGAKAQGVNLDFADLTQVSLVNAELQGASVWNAILDRALLWETNLRGADLSASSLEYAIIWADYGKLAKDRDLELVPDERIDGYYQSVREQYRASVWKEASTEWPSNEGESRCLLVDFDDKQKPNDPHCAFLIGSETDKLRTFWMMFAGIDGATLCRKSHASQIEPLQSVPTLQVTMRSISMGNSFDFTASMGVRIATALAADLTSPACQAAWPRAALEAILKRLDKQIEREDIVVEVAFHRAWLDALEEADYQFNSPGLSAQ